MRRASIIGVIVSLALCAAAGASHAKLPYVLVIFQTQDQTGPQTFSGRIVSQNGVRYVLRDDENGVWYHIDDQDKAGKFFGKDVLVTGNFDGLTGTIRVETIVEATPEAKARLSAEIANRNREPAASKPAAPPGAKSAPPDPVQATPAPPSAKANLPGPEQANPAREPTRTLPEPRSDEPLRAEVQTPKRTQSEGLAKPVEKVPSNSFLSLPEEAIGASSTVAVSSQRSIPVPPGFNPQAHYARDLQVGRLLTHVNPSYPLDAKQQKIEGTVRLNAVVGKDGTVAKLEPVSGPPALVESAVEAVRQWRYSPTLLDGQRIEIQEEIRFVFRLPD